MLKIIPIIALFFLHGIKLFAQCTPDTSIHKAGFYPKTLPDAEINKLYDQTINFKIFKDTVVDVLGSPQTAVVDSAVIMKVDNMPPGLTFKLNKKSQSYTPLEVGCANISGTPSKSGKYTLDIIITFYAKVLGFPVMRLDTINTFSINVTGTASTNVIKTNDFKIYPNPISNDELNIEILHNTNPNELKIYDIKGALIFKSVLNETSTKLKFEYPSGLYNLIINNKCYRILKN
ncbi:MAG: T9SS type A sorting domain-containing protein [Bacteroidia bacterium]|nr:T9SS type A sorting domain-containing protein [Bacteroidia bacterium]